MKGKLTLAVLFSVLIMFATVPSVFANHSGNLNCDDFDTQAEAQAHLEAHPNDPDGLDGEGDGVPCEGLPSGDSDASSNDNTSTDNDSDNTSSEESTSSDESTTSEETTSSEEQGGELPDTASTLPLGILGGLVAMVLGALGMRKGMRKQQ
ncbi:excalibur calcium-binding domain-containing protein [Virgibacillus ihumii]|uniref:excalibur calcium-binding domain-containing protein n=1 Tax=Virgibacillus ihumii TaxID=2686091 RepID=UPI00157C1961|nr:excalibur calcium-binding domain-containing protein [Virgibacillus ihumii]